MYLNTDSSSSSMALSSLITYNSTSNSVNIPQLYIDEVAFTSFNSDSDGSILHASGSINVTISNCVFTNNTSNNGGSIYFNNTISGAININDCQFIDNMAKINGSAIYFDTNIFSVNIISSSFYNNTATKGGGALFFRRNTKNINILYTEFMFNQAIIQGGTNAGGGAIAFEKDYHKVIYIYNSTFISNYAKYGNTNTNTNTNILQ